MSKTQQMTQPFYSRIQATLDRMTQGGTLKPERIIDSPQAVRIDVRQSDGTTRSALNFCANNYLGLADDPRVMRAGQDAIARWGFGLGSVRFICGTQGIHKELERQIADWLGYEDCITFAACFDANGAVFEPLLDEADAIVSDSLNHASIIDGIRLCKARRYRYRAGDMNDLESQLLAARVNGARSVLIVTDGVFSMDGTIADLSTITDLATRHDALVMVDDCHATGLLGPEGRGTAALRAVEGRIDILTGTLGKALGGAMGGFICARREVVALLRQRARPYLFSNALSPANCGGALEAIRIARSAEGDERRRTLLANAHAFRSAMTTAAFDVPPGEHPIVPVMLGEARRATQLAASLHEMGIFVSGFSFPVVPHGQARIRVQLSAAHRPEHLDTATDAFRLADRRHAAQTR